MGQLFSKATFKHNIYALKYINTFHTHYITFTVLTRLRICRPPSSQFWSSFHKRCEMCRNEWKINFPIFIFRVIVKIHRKLTVFRLKMTITPKIKIGKILDSIFLLIQLIPHLTCKFDNFWKKNYIFFILMYACKTMNRLLRNMPLTLTCSD